MNHQLASDKNVLSALVQHSLLFCGCQNLCCRFGRFCSTTRSRDHGIGHMCLSTRKTLTFLRQIFPLSILTFITHSAFQFEFGGADGNRDRGRCGGWWYESAQEGWWDLKARWPGCSSHAQLCAEHTSRTLCSAHHPGNPPPSLASEPSQAFNRAASQTPTISKHLIMSSLACSTKQKYAWTVPKMSLCTNMTIHPCRVQWRGAGQAGRGIEEQVSSAAQRTERHFKAMIVVVVDRWREEKTTL